MLKALEKRDNWAAQTDMLSIMPANNFKQWRILSVEMKKLQMDYNFFIEYHEVALNKHDSFAADLLIHKQGDNPFLFSTAIEGEDKYYKYVWLAQWKLTPFVGFLFKCLTTQCSCLLLMPYMDDLEEREGNSNIFLDRVFYLYTHSDDCSCKYPQDPVPEKA